MKGVLAMIVAFGFGTVATAADRPVADLVEGRCALCHGMEGESASAVFPRLAAQHPEYIGKQLRDFRDGRRKGTMNEMAADLSNQEIAGLAAHFSAKPAQSRAATDADLAAVGRYIFLKGNSFSGVAACASCHGLEGHGTHQLPRLAGQHPSYLEVQLKDFNQRARTNDNAVMHAVASKLTELEIRAVAIYLGGLK